MSIVIPFSFLNRCLYDELDNALADNFLWLNRAECMPARKKLKKSPRTYRVTLDVSEFNPGSIKTEITKENKLVVNAREEVKEKNEDFSLRELKKTYDLPHEAELDKLVSFVNKNGQLVIEVPLKENQKKAEEKENLAEFIPKISEDGKSVSFDFRLPKHIDSNKVSITRENRDLIIRAEDENDSLSKHFILPDNTDFDSIKCSLNEDNHVLHVNASLLPELKKKIREIPIEFAKK